ncbi:MAG TPA: cupin domain-containing protein [Gammaproteobacteria bacterium]|nr:cupin domain-containing protein [Gammaproteobacteria bacterium]
MTHARSCGRTEALPDYALGLLPAAEASAVQAHLAECAACRAELAALRRTVEAFAHWPTDVLRPPRSLAAKLEELIGAEAPARAAERPSGAERRPAAKPTWRQVAPGISVQILAQDDVTHVVSMLVRLEPNTYYPPHRHAAVEELHLLDGELWIEDRLLHPGDYNRGEPGTADQRVYSETGCTCVLITSVRDVLA